MMEEYWEGHPEYQPQEYSEPIAYPLFDAYMHELLSEMLRGHQWISFTRRALTSGSCRYRFQGIGDSDRRLHIGDIILQTNWHDATVVRLIPPDRPDKSAHKKPGSFLLNLLHQVMREMDEEKNENRRPNLPRSFKGIEDLMLGIFGLEGDLLPKKRRGANQDPINQEAREAITKGEDRKAVFRRWAKAKAYNLSDPDDRRKAENAFRRMVNTKLQDRQ
jgi:hypothetical protein